MKKLFHWVWSFLEVFIILYVIVITSFILCRNKYGFTQFGDYTFDHISLVDERNILNTKKGDLLIVRNSNGIEVGDLIYYYAAYNESYVVRTDYVMNVEDDGYSSLYTVNHNGEEVTIANTRVLGKYATTYPSIGGILDILESRFGFLFLVLLPIMIVFIYQVYEFIVIIRYEQIEEDAEENDEVQEVKGNTPTSEEIVEKVKAELRKELQEEVKKEKIVEEKVEKVPEKSEPVKEKAPKKDDKFQFVDDDDIEIL